MRKKLLFVMLPIILLMTGNTQGQTIINSLAELKAQLDTSNGNFKMTAGTYYFNTGNCGPGKLFPNSDILLFTGSNSTFDFTDVKFEFDTEIFTVYTNWAVNFWPTGNNNVYLNLTMENIGMKIPNAGGEAIHLDGNDNRIEGFHITVRSSYPYGYGDIFGKGGGSVISHKKRAGILVRGDRNHVKNCTVIMESYGHGIFMQGAKDALIEGCHVEGQLRTIKEVLEEEGTGSPADNVNFMSVWGYDLRNLQHDYRFSLQEDGIRAYTTGGIYGTTEERSTTGTQVVNCTVVKMRSGVTIGWDYTSKIVQNCKVLACETGYWFGSNTTATGCSGDASIGPLVSEDVGRSNSTIELTLLDNYVPKIGNTPHFYFAGNGHNLTLHDGTTSFDSDINLQVGGKRVAHRWLEGSGEEPLNKTATNCTFTNNTKYPVVLSDNATNNSVFSCGTITDNGSGNSKTTLTNCSYTRTCNNTPENLQAECYDTMSGIATQNITGSNNEREVYDIHTGDWISFNNIDLTNMVSIEAMVSSVNNDVFIEVRNGSAMGTVLATIPISSTSSYQKFSANLNQMASGLTTVYFVFTSPTATGELFKLDKLNFVKNPCATTSYNPFLPISAEDFCESSGIVVANLSTYNQAVTEIDNADYIRFSNVDFGYDDVYNSVKILASSSFGQGTIEVRSGAVDGNLLATVIVGSTGSLNDYKVFSSFTTGNITGVHDIYLVFTGSGENLLNIDNFYFRYDGCFGANYNAYTQTEAVDYCEMFGVVPINNSYLGGINDKEWIRFGSVDFTTVAPAQITVNVAGYPTDETVANGYINVMLDHPVDGTMIGTITVPKTGGWESWQEVTTFLLQEVKGVHNVYLYFGNGAFNIDWFKFHQKIVVLENLALASRGSIATQSSTLNASVAGLAIDGNTDGNYNNGSVSHTNNGNGTAKWWQVDLKDDFIIETIKIFNRTGGTYSDRLVNFTVEVIDANNNITFSQFFSTYPNPSMTIETGSKIGRIVKISKTDGRDLTIAEVQVFGSSVLSVDDFKFGQVKLYPNPTTNQVTIENGLGLTLEIYNILGTLESKIHVSEDEKVINIEHLNSGIHLLKFSNALGSTVKKLVKK